MDPKFLTLPVITDKNIFIDSKGKGTLVGKIGNRDLSKENVAVMCYADWCGHCHHLAPTFYKSYEPIRHSVIMCRVDCSEHDDTNSKITNLFEVRGYPTILKFKKGKFMGHFDDERNAEKIMCYALGVKGSIKLENNTTLTCN